MELNRAQLCLLRSIKSTGFPAELLQIFLGRCGATVAEWQALLDADLVTAGKRAERGRYVITKAGTTAYNHRPKHIYF
jgi:hypothetical protein